METLFQPLHSNSLAVAVNNISSNLILLLQTGKQKSIEEFSSFKSC